MADNDHRETDRGCLKAIFSQALTKKTGAERQSYLAEACRDDDPLRNLVESLLAAHEQAGDFLRRSVLGDETDPLSEGPGTVIGHYRLVQKVGEGGFGIVYLAEQEKPVRRQVALKIIKLGMDTRQVIARFEAERQALALMDHPNIAHVYEAGASETGRPYFVMELVRGAPITEYCDTHCLDTAQRLDLFMQVCGAVQHAHQKGIIHRDLKPSNVVVALQDGKPVPKVIDFGIAKSMQIRLTDKTQFTRQDLTVGTPAYMSPEQVGLREEDLDTRSDIYSLGVLLYELLTGSLPFGSDTLRQMAIEEVRRVIREQEPRKPSTRLACLGAKATEAARRRALEPARLTRLLRGDLDWIVMKALEKERNRRYETVSGLVQDLRRHLAHEPVTAGPPRAAYRMGKFVRRHRQAVLAGSAVLVALLVGLVLATVGFVRAGRDQKRALAAERQAEAISQFLQRDLLEQADPYRNPHPDPDLRLRTVVDRAAEKAEGSFEEQPLVEAAIRLTLARTYAGLRESDLAEPHVRRAVDLRTKELGGEHPSTLEALNDLGELLLSQGRWRASEKIHRYVVEARRRVLGPEHPDTLVSMNNVGAICSWLQLPETETWYRDALALQHRLLGSEHPATLSTTVNLALLLQRSWTLPEAISMHEEALRARRRVLSPDHPDTIASLVTVADCYRRCRQHQDALSLYEEVLERRRRSRGDNHALTQGSSERLGTYYGRLANWERAYNHLQEVVRFRTNDLRTQLQLAVAAQLAGNQPACHAACQVLANQLPKTSDSRETEEILETLLILSDEVAGPSPVCERADLLHAANSDWTWFRLVKGMADYRRGRWADAAGVLHGIEDHWKADTACLAAYFLAMAWRQQQQPDAALAIWAKTEVRLREILEVGDLGDAWVNHARSLVVRGEAQRLLVKPDQSLSVDAETLARARLPAGQSWQEFLGARQPILDSLRQAEEAGARQQWGASRDAYAKALAEPMFDWRTGCDLDWRLPVKVAVSYLLAGDIAMRANLYDTLLRRRGRFFQQQLGDLCGIADCLRSEDLPASTRDAMRELSWLRYGDKPPPADQSWVNLETGGRAYRAGEFERAIDPLMGARQSTDLACRGQAMILQAIVLQRLNRPTQARAALDQAESLLQEPLRRFEGAQWWNLGLCLLFLEEAYELFGIPEAERSISIPVSAKARPSPSH